MAHSTTPTDQHPWRIAPKQAKMSCLADKQTMFFRTGIFQVDVGKDDDMVTFHIHISVACKYSGFFRSAVIWSWVRSTGDVVNLPNYEPNTFELYLQWRYTNTLPVSEESEDKPEYCDLLLLAKAYALGAYLADTFFQDAVADALMHRLYAKRETWGRCKGCRWEFVAYLYDKTVSSSPIRHLLVAMLARDYERWLAEVGAAGLPKEFLSDMLNYVAGVTAHRPMQEYWGKCTFHLHEAEQECYRRHFMVD
ncbi:hypothetical protein CFD26_108684 [Aspergillus turcosus]|uniref:BTB domain-containing protein n=1 Tax=Aspergillus turcosus TaxID=1245748 RepID=A0A3R7M3W4_9EURO|nr:hypothetical protein CFD26_108684 [Aspergillus turcosus]